MNENILTKKSLGQHWLKDKKILNQIAEYVDIEPGETIIEVGPGLGTLTEAVQAYKPSLIAVEFDRERYADLQKRYVDRPVEEFRLVNEDILKFRFDKIEAKYKVVGNIPYYLTSNLIRTLCELPNPPQKVVFLVQKEVAERVCAGPGQMSLLSVWTQMYYSCRLGVVVPAGLFSPPPKVDSQVVILDLLPKPKFEPADKKLLNQILKSAYVGKRKTLTNTLSGSLGYEKSKIIDILENSGLKSTTRPQELSVSKWLEIIDKLK